MKTIQMIWMMIVFLLFGWLATSTLADERRAQRPKPGKRIEKAARPVPAESREHAGFHGTDYRRVPPNIRPERPRHPSPEKYYAYRHRPVRPDHHPYDKYDHGPGNHHPAANTRPHAFYVRPLIPLPGIIIPIPPNPAIAFGVIIESR